MGQWVRMVGPRVRHCSGVTLQDENFHWNLNFTNGKLTIFYFLLYFFEFGSLY